MIGLTLTIAPLVALTRAIDRVVDDPKPTLADVAYPWLLAHVEQQLETSGAHGGQAWTFDQEPRYAAFKRALMGEDLGGRPLVVDPAHARLAPSLTDPSDPDHVLRLERGALEVGSSLDYASRLLFEGGVGPYGEVYPARNPFEMTAAQEDELLDLVRADLRARTKRGR